MDRLKQWWNNDLSKGVKFVLLVLLANGLPAFIILMTIPNQTETFFVWTIKPAINARLIGVMYSNAMLLIIFSAFQTKWENVRVNMVVITLFSVFATILTFFYLKPFLAHPWFHLAYWLTMYLILFFAAPYIFWTHEKKHGGKLPVYLPLNLGARATLVASLFASLVCGLGLIFNIELVNQYWPWTLPPLVGGLIGVLFTTHTFAYAWAIWDGDWLRVRPIFWQAIPTGVMFILLPLLHPADLHADAGTAAIIYYALAGFAVLANSAVVLSYRTLEKSHAHG
jgi:hypothetical protein